MSYRWGFVAGSLVAALAGLSGCDMLSGEKYRVSATVDVNGTLYTGSSVQQFKCHEGGGIFGGLDVSQCQVKGEAVVVDLKDRGYLFLVFKGPNGDMSSMVRSLLTGGPQDPVPSGHPTAWHVPTEAMPMMVTFQNPGKPETAEEVDKSDFAKTFGTGVTLKTITVDPTDEPLTRGKIYAILPWLKTLGNLTLDGQFGSSSNKLSNRLQKSDFVYGE